MAPSAALCRSIAQIASTSRRLHSCARFVRPQVASRDSPLFATALSDRSIPQVASRDSPLFATALSDRSIPTVRNAALRMPFSSASRYSDIPAESEPVDKSKRGKRVWKANPGMIDSDGIVNDEKGSIEFAKNYHWDRAVDDVSDRRIVDERLARITEQERQGGRMMQSQQGVLREDPHDDMRLLLENYTAAALASALRDREDTLQHCATLLAHNQLDELAKILHPYEQQHIIQRRHTKEKMLDFRVGFDRHNIELLRKALNRMPRRVSTAHSKRAAVVLPLCNVEGVPCILFEKRSRQLRAHPDEVCLPGGMVSEEGEDRSIVQTCLREMEEEIGIGHHATTVLGILRCNWGEVHHLVGVAVTPVVCFLGEIGETELNPNPDEVAECFTVPLESFLDRDRWVHKKHYAPFFTGGPHTIWGLTGYIVHRFMLDVIERYDVIFDKETG